MRCGLRGEGQKNLKFHVVHQNERNLKCSSLGWVVKLWGEGCGCEGVLPDPLGRGGGDKKS